MARAIDELMKIRSSSKVNIEVKLQMLVAIENLLPDDRRDLRVRMYQQLMIPFAVSNGARRGDQPSIEDMIIDSALTMIGPSNHKYLKTLGLELVANEIRSTVTPGQMTLASGDMKNREVETIDLTHNDDSNALGLKEVLGKICYSANKWRLLSVILYTQRAFGVKTPPTSIMNPVSKVGYLYAFNLNYAVLLCLFP